MLTADNASGTKKLRCIKVTVGANDVEHEVICLADEDGNLVNLKQDANGYLYIVEALPSGYGVARVDTSSTTDVVAAVDGKSIYVLGYQLQGKGDVEAKFGDDTPADLSPEWDMNAREGAVVPIKEWPYYYFKTGVGKKLVITLDAAVVVTGNVQYVRV